MARHGMPRGSVGRGSGGARGCRLARLTLLALLTGGVVGAVAALAAGTAGVLGDRREVGAHVEHHLGAGLGAEHVVGTVGVLADALDRHGRVLGRDRSRDLGQRGRDAGVRGEVVVQVGGARTLRAGKLRIDDLLSHRVGLPHNSLDRALEADSPYPLLLEQLDEVTPVCSVGSCYSYQNVAFSLIGDVTFAVTGDFFTHQVEKRIFHPLMMETATYGRDALEASGDWAHPHVKRSGRWQSVLPKLTYYRIPPAAGVNASARDLGQWMLAHLDASACAPPRMRWAGGCSTTADTA